MPTIISHAAIPLAAGLGIGEKYIPRKLILAGVIASMLPDADVVLFRFGARYDSDWAHRGFTHSIGFAVILTLLAGLLFRKTIPPAISAAFVGLSSVSHGLLDMLTNGGHGVAILWPVRQARYFFDWRPIEVSPLAASRFLSRALLIARSEFLWIWVPAIIVAVGLRALRHHQGANA